MIEAFGGISAVVGVAAVALLAAAFVDRRTANWLASMLRARAIYLEAMAKEREKHRAAAQQERTRLMEEWQA